MRIEWGSASGNGEKSAPDGRRPSRRGLMAGGCLAALAVLLAWAVPALAGSSTVTYYACVTSKTGSIKVVSNTAKCATGEHKISWNNVGPAGPKGPRGAQGPAGVVAGYQSSVDNDTTLSSTEFTAISSLTLPAGHFLVNASISISPDAPDVITCEVFDSKGTVMDGQSVSAPVSSDAFVGLTGLTANGGNETVACEDTASADVGYAVSVTAIRVNSVAFPGVMKQLPHRVGSR